MAITDTRGKRILVTLVVIAMIAGLCLQHYHGRGVSPLQAFSAKLTSNDRQTILIIMTQTRSGSSFAGSVFAATNDSTYLYEPLYPFGMQCRFEDEKEALLKQLLSCDFSELKIIYKYGFKKSEFKDGATCMKNGFCFTKASTGLLDKYGKVCKNNGAEPNITAKSNKCGYPLRPDILRTVCQSSSLLVTKITRICTLGEMEKIYRHLSTGKREVFILHLVRDLRSIASSILKLQGKDKIEKVVNDITHSRCPQQRRNLEYSDLRVITDGRYMRIRYEDLSTNAVKEADKVFRFMGRSLPPEVISNIQNYLHPNQSVLKQLQAKGKANKMAGDMLREYRNPFGIVRDPTKVLDQWRNLVPFRAVQDIQVECGDVLKQMGYVIFESEGKMKDLTLPSFRNLPG